MSLLRTLSRQLASNSFRLAVLLFAVICAILAAFGTAQPVKNALKDSGVYTTLAETVVKQATSADNKAAAEKDALQQPEVQEAAKAAFSPAFLQSSSEQIIDGTYHWLEGKAANPDFKVDLTPAVSVFEDKAADAASSRVKKLPVCTLQQLRGINLSSIDPLKLTCLPPGFNVDAQRQTFINSVAGSNEFLKDPVLTADRIPKDSNGQTVFERAKIAPNIFRWLTVAPWILGVLALLLGVAVILLSTPRRKGIGRLAVSFLGIGLLLIVISFLAGFLFTHFFSSSSSPLHITDGSAQQSVVAVIGAFNGLIRKSLLLFGGIYAGIGIIALIVLRLTRTKTPVSDPLNERRTAVRNEPSAMPSNN